jgi:hypothetical protein
MSLTKENFNSEAVESLEIAAILQPIRIPLAKQ